MKMESDLRDNLNLPAAKKSLIIQHTRPPTFLLGSLINDVNHNTYTCTEQIEGFIDE